MGCEMDGLVREQRTPLAPQDDLIELFDRHDAAEQDVEEAVLEQQGELPEVAGAPVIAHPVVAPAPQNKPANAAAAVASRERNFSRDLIDTYFRQMGDGELLSREQEIALAKRIEAAQLNVQKSSHRNPCADRAHWPLGSPGARQRAASA